MTSVFKKLVTAVLLGGVMAIFAGCGDTITNTTQAASVPGTLQGKLIDAVTGQPITDSTTATEAQKTKVYLIQGTNTRRPDKLDVSPTSDLAGEYAINNIPVVTTASNATWKIVVLKEGYQRFESEFSFTGADIKPPAANDPSLVYAGAYNKIGNIYLYPKNVNAADYTVTVKYNSKAVPGAVVELRQNIEANAQIIAQQGGTTGTLNTAADTHRLFPSKGLTAALSVTTGTDGKATFKGTDLVLGGSYSPVVLPVVTPAADGGFQLATAFGTTFVEGTDYASNAAAISQTITPLLTTANSANGLYIASVDNTNTSGVLRSSGVLTIKFSRPVELSNSATANATTGAAAPFTADTVFGYFATLSGNPSTPGLTASINLPALDSVANASIKPVAAALSADGLTLTLTPNLKTIAAATDFDLAVTYTAGAVFGAISYVEPTISIVGAPEVKFSLFGTSGTQLFKADGTTIAGSTKVNMIGSRP